MTLTLPTQCMHELRSVAVRLFHTTWQTIFRSSRKYVMGKELNAEKKNIRDVYGCYSMQNCPTHDQALMSGHCEYVSNHRDRCSPDVIEVKKVTLITILI
jgi:hypothetical protein